MFLLLRTRQRWIGRTCTGLAALVISGCGRQTDLFSAIDQPPTVVMTFDDGPLPADWAIANEAAGDEHVLDPLHLILDGLRRNAVQAVFYIKGPGSESAAAELGGVFGAALRDIHADGQTTGYHGFRHDPDLWANSVLPTALVVAAMSNDLDREAEFLSESLAGQGLSSADVVAPVFRQPYGGLAIDQTAARLVAAQRGLIYHGFRIDSGDWVVNADAPADIVARLPIATEADQVAFIRGRLRAGRRQNAGREVVDVLFHVNALTAAHVQDWIDELRADFTTPDGSLPTFEVPLAYLQQADAFVDLSIVAQALSFPNDAEALPPSATGAD